MNESNPHPSPRAPRITCGARKVRAPQIARTSRIARVPVLLLLLLLLLAAAGMGLPETAHAQASAADFTGVEAEVMTTVDRLFDGMRARDGDMVRSVFHPAARMATASFTPEGDPSVNVGSVDGFVEAVGQGGDAWNEPYWNPVVQIDGGLAQVWIFYRFHAGDTFSHCGHNAIQLVRDPDRGWVIIGVTDSRRTTDCDPPDA